MTPGDDRLYAYSGGQAYEPGLPCIVLLHGAQHDHSVWILQSRWLAHHGYNVLAFDLPGHGRSGGAAATTVEQAAEHLALALCKRVAAGATLVIVGHSMGSLIAIELAQRLVNGGYRIAGLALLAVGYPMRVADSLLSATRDAPDAAMAMINVWSHAPSIAPFAARPSLPGPGFNVVWSNLRLMQSIATRNGAAVLATDFAACNAYAGGLDHIASLQCPMLFILGKADAMTPPRSARALIEAAQKSTVLELPGCGHAMMSERPDEVRQALARFAALACAGASDDSISVSATTAALD